MKLVAHYSADDVQELIAQDLRDKMNVASKPDVTCQFSATDILGQEINVRSINVIADVKVGD